MTTATQPVGRIRGVRAVVGAGLRITELHEPSWPPAHDRPWGGWGPVRGALVPGTLIISAAKR